MASSCLQFLAHSSCLERGGGREGAGFYPSLCLLFLRSPLQPWLERQPTGDVLV